MEWLKHKFIDKAKVASAIGMSKQLFHMKMSEKYLNKFSDTEKEKIKSEAEDLKKLIDKG